MGENAALQKCLELVFDKLRQAGPCFLFAHFICEFWASMGSQAQYKSVGDLTEETVLLRERGSTTRAAFGEALKLRRVTLKNTLELGSREAIQEAVAEGLGVGIVNEREMGRDSRLHKLAVRDAFLTVVEYAACLADNKENSTVSAFMELALETAKL